MRAHHGLKKAEFELTDDALQEVIRTYTREAGVRTLEREIASVCRKVAREVLKKGKDKPKLPRNWKMEKDAAGTG